MTQIETQLQNEVVLWKLRFIRGICIEVSRQKFYELFGQYTTFNGMLDTVIECEKSIAMRLKQNTTKMKEQQQLKLTRLRTHLWVKEEKNTRVKRQMSKLGCSRVQQMQN